MQPRPKGTAVVRQSKYRHLFGTPFQSNECASGVKLGAIQVEANALKANGTFFAVPWSITGTIGVVPVSQRGALAEIPLIIHDETAANDFNFHPFNDNLIASACQDGTVWVWDVPQGGLTENLTKPVKIFNASDKRLLSIDFHPLASDVAVITDAGKALKFWDFNTFQERLALNDAHKGLITNISWNYDGSLCATSCKDKTLRILDPRSSKAVAEVADHQGTKGGRVLWMGKKDRILSVGFSKASERQWAMYDPRKLSERLTLETIDNSSSSLLPFFDEDNGILWLAGKGDGNIRYYEVVDEPPYMYYLNDFKSKDPQSGVAALPKACCDVSKCEIMRLLKVTPQGQVVPIKFEVPRTEAQFHFQEDLFPDSWDGKASMTADQWFSGATNPPNLISLNPAKK